MKRIIFIVTPQWKKPAESRTERVYAAAAIFIQIRAGIGISIHFKVRQDQSVYDTKFQEEARRAAGVVLSPMHNRYISYGSRTMESPMP